MLVENSEVLPLVVRVVAVTVGLQPPVGGCSMATPLPSATALLMNAMPGPWPPGARLVR
jgi:hypothetical protein